MSDKINISDLELEYENLKEDFEAAIKWKVHVSADQQSFSVNEVNSAYETVWALQDKLGAIECILVAESRYSCATKSR